MNYFEFTCFCPGDFFCFCFCFSFLQQHDRNPYIQAIRGNQGFYLTVTHLKHFGITVWSSSNSCVDGCSPKYQRVASRYPSLSLCSARRGGTRRRLLGWSAAGLRVCTISASVATDEGLEAVTFSPSLAKRYPSRSIRTINSPASHLALSSNSPSRSPLHCSGLVYPPPKTPPSPAYYTTGEFPFMPCDR
jgi:hypothetical protein